MNWLKTIADIIVTVVSINDRLFVRIHRCPCGKAGARLHKNHWGRWYVYCSHPRGCKRRAEDAKTRRRAKLTWNQEIKGA